MGTVADWVSAAADVILALSVVIGALIAVRRWPIGLHARAHAGPFHTVSITDGIEHPPVVGWLLELSLVSGEVAHIGKVRVERFRQWRWKDESGLVDYNKSLPVSLAKDGKITLHVSTAKADKAPMRLVIYEYRALRKVTLPFVDLAKG